MVNLLMFVCFSLSLEQDMSHTINSYNPKPHIPEYYSMPGQFDLRQMVRQSVNKLNSYHGNVQFKPIPFDDVLYTLVEPTLLRKYHFFLSSNLI